MEVEQVIQRDNAPEVSSSEMVVINVKNSGCANEVVTEFQAVINIHQMEVMWQDDMEENFDDTPQYAHCVIQAL